MNWKDERLLEELIEEAICPQCTQKELDYKVSELVSKEDYKQAIDYVYDRSSLCYYCNENK